MTATAICTVSLGRAFAALGELTHPTMRRYAARIGADFLVLDQRAYPARVPPAYEKLRVGELLARYERVAYLDTDVIVRPDAPSLFDVVAPHDLGVLNELPWFPTDARRRVAGVCSQLGVELPRYDWHRRYFQTGVLVASRRHARLFAPPRLYFSNHPWEQTWLNVRLAQEGFAVHELPWRFNRVGCMDRRLEEPRAAAYLIHYAGTAPGAPYGFGHALRPGEALHDLIRRDLAAWGG